MPKFIIYDLLAVSDGSNKDRTHERQNLKLPYCIMFTRSKQAKKKGGYKMAYNLRLRELRENRGLSQRQVAERLNVSPGAVARWELGDNKPTMDNLLALAALLECSTDTLLSRDSPPPAG